MCNTWLSAVRLNGSNKYDTKSLTIEQQSMNKSPFVWLIQSSDGIFLYPYDDRMCYFDAVIEKF